jgi:hypothetical protein
MMPLWVVLIWICWISVIPSLAQIYRWTDEKGGVHYTDNPGTIPPERRPHSMRSLPPVSEEAADAAPTPQRLPPPFATRGGPQDNTLPAEDVSLLQQHARALEQQIAALRQERQTLLEQLKAVRPIKTNPAFGQKRRQVETAGRSLAAIEQQLDALYAELLQVQTTLQERESGEPSAETQSPRATGVDRQGHDRAYWQQRLEALRTRLQQAREERQAILEQLAPETGDTRQAFGRRGREVLELVQRLEQADQDMRQAEAALQALQQDATRAGAPAAWLQ